MARIAGGLGAAAAQWGAAGVLSGRRRTGYSLWRRRRSILRAEIFATDRRLRDSLGGRDPGQAGWDVRMFLSWRRGGWCIFLRERRIRRTGGGYGLASRQIALPNDPAGV